MSVREESARAVVAVDIGGTKIAAALVREGGQIGHRVQRPTPAAKGAAAILDAAAALVREVIEAAGPVAAVGVGSAGAFDEDGIVTHATDHLAGWRGTAVAAGLVARLGVPVVVVNDVHAAALGELALGSDRDRFVFVAVGTGIGGAVVSEGVLLRGASGMAGSIGHLRAATMRGRVCSCGGRDHVEAFASGPGIERSFAERTGIAVPLREVARRAREGDTVAAQVIAAAADELGASLAPVIATVDPGLVLLGGGVSELGAALVEPLTEGLRAELRAPFADVRIEIARAGTDAALRGAAWLARVGNDAARALT
ncbi:glucokinase [Microbacterium sp. AG790]|uniref:ROK family protein n=1 Tax=Microbacterium sp. AG790 TaxID=2183995 RepID=UPI000EAE6062|nr:ROK family protein [Microbacterium sp. AG790]RKS93203.1 glucokinase [Microbacterium sp. AG790]